MINTFLNSRNSYFWEDREGRMEDPTQYSEDPLTVHLPSYFPGILHLKSEDEQSWNSYKILTLSPFSKVFASFSMMVTQRGSKNQRKLFQITNVLWKHKAKQKKRKQSLRICCAWRGPELASQHSWWLKTVLSITLVPGDPAHSSVFHSHAQSELT